MLQFAVGLLKWAARQVEKVAEEIQTAVAVVSFFFET